MDLKLRLREQKTALQTLQSWTWGILSRCLTEEEEDVLKADRSNDSHNGLSPTSSLRRGFISQEKHKTTSILLQKWSSQHRSVLSGCQRIGSAVFHVG